VTIEVGQLYQAMAPGRTRAGSILRLERLFELDGNAYADLKPLNPRRLPFSVKAELLEDARFFKYWGMSL
jgi:hypothetical protein